jgi:hypothetical protein
MRVSRCPAALIYLLSIGICADTYLLVRVSGPAFKVSGSAADETGKVSMEKSNPAARP